MSFTISEDLPISCLSNSAILVTGMGIPLPTLYIVCSCLGKYFNAAIIELTTSLI